MSGPAGRLAALALAAALLLPQNGAWAASRPAKAPPPPPAMLPPSRPEPLPPYQDDLDSLAEVLGTLTFMEGLCAGTDTEWRSRMADLLAAEGTTDTRRGRLAGRFNRGFEGYRLAYRACTPAARAVIARARDEGARLTARLAHRFVPG